MSNKIKTDSEQAASSDVETIVILRCDRCGERGRCQDIINPSTNKREFWVTPERKGRCSNYQGNIKNICKTDDFPTERAAIKTWNFERAKAK